MLPAIVPNAEVLPNFNVPALIVVDPAYPFVPDKVMLPEPSLTIPPLETVAERIKSSAAAPSAIINVGEKVFKFRFPLILEGTVLALTITLIPLYAMIAEPVPVVIVPPVSVTVLLPAAPN